MQWEEERNRGELPLGPAEGKRRGLLVPAKRNLEALSGCEPRPTHIPKGFNLQSEGLPSRATLECCNPVPNPEAG